MKTISLALQQHIAQTVTTLAGCVKASLKNGTVLGFTNHDRDIEVDGVRYQALAGFDSTDVASNNDLDVDNLEIVGLLNSPSITEDDLRAGLWDGAGIEIFQVNWDDLTMGIMWMRVGTLGTVTVDRGMFRAELLGLMFAYQQSIGEVTQAGCRANFCDARCGLIETGVSGSPGGQPSYTVAGTVTTFNVTTLTISDATRTEPTDRFAHGKVTFTGGLNNGLTFEVKSSVVGALTLQAVPPYTVAPGDTYSAVWGCDKKRTTCRDDFGNVINFRGEPFLQGNDKLAQIGRHG